MQGCSLLKMGHWKAPRCSAPALCRSVPCAALEAAAGGAREKAQGMGTVLHALLTQVREMEAFRRARAEGSGCATAKLTTGSAAAAAEASVRHIGLSPRICGA